MHGLENQRPLSLKNLVSVLGSREHSHHLFPLSWAFNSSPHVNTGLPIANTIEWLKSNLKYKWIVSICYQKKSIYQYLHTGFCSLSLLNPAFTSLVIFHGIWHIFYMCLWILLQKFHNFARHSIISLVSYHKLLLFD